MLSVTSFKKLWYAEKTIQMHKVGWTRKKIDDNSKKDSIRSNFFQETLLTSNRFQMIKLDSHASVVQADDQMSKVVGYCEQKFNWITSFNISLNP